MPTKQMPRKKDYVIAISEIGRPYVERDNLIADGYNLCHDEFTAYLEEIIKQLEAEMPDILAGAQVEIKPGIYDVDVKKLFTAIKTMILGKEE